MLRSTVRRRESRCRTPSVRSASMRVARSMNEMLPPDRLTTSRVPSGAMDGAARPIHSSTTHRNVRAVSPAVGRKSENLQQLATASTTGGRKRRRSAKGGGRTTPIKLGLAAIRVSRDPALGAGGPRFEPGRPDQLIRGWLSSHPLFWCPGPQHHVDDHERIFHRAVRATDPARPVLVWRSHRADGGDTDRGRAAPTR